MEKGHKKAISVPLVSLYILILAHHPLSWGQDFKKFDANFEINFKSCKSIGVDLKSGTLKVIESTLFSTKCLTVTDELITCSYYQESGKPKGNENYKGGKLDNLGIFTNGRDYFHVDLNTKNVFFETGYTLDGHIRGRKVCTGKFSYETTRK